VVVVADTGIGMDVDTLERAFEPFYTTKPIGQGTGLGLSMVYGFAHQSGGQVRIDSKPGSGTKIRIYLPAAVGASTEMGAPAEVATIAGAGERVLLVEDDDSVRMLASDLLGELGYDPIEAATPDMAITRLAAGEKFSLLVTDIGLPGMNGRQLADIARSHLPGLPVLFMTGYAENAADRSTFLGKDMQLITKPFAIDELSRRIGSMISA
jgi:CheY-like chemotaxis protein